MLTFKTEKRPAMARKSLSANLGKPVSEKAADAAKIAQQLTGGGKGSSAPQASTDAPEYETVSYNLPLDLIDLYRDLAAERHRVDQAHKRDLRRRIKDAKRAGMPPPMEAPPQARQSASALVREAMEAHRANVEAELERLK
jgi:hypothetical protein